ncbi:ATP-binding protein [Methanobrevibacter sp. 87.7]|uniref:NOP5/NOP56 family protein n=1 Tax=Methanobrevibacter sp. 87.7 TaxID=387957 RepID=UPI000B50FC21|nr:ATP-binding protein [Methanobrevibacter sp. 87.7]OWT33088.1 ATP-binding protein [Methanobrevibacter sp. 87.7]
MKIYITNCIAGYLCFNNNFELIDYILFKEEDIVNKLIEIEKNNITSEEREIISHIDDSYDEIIIETRNKHSDYKNIENYDKIKIEIPSKAGNYLRENLIEILEEINFINNPEEYREKLVNITNKIAILKMKESSQEEDKLLIQAINSIDEIDEGISKLIERIREWETIYFPEIETIHNNEAYIKLIADFNNREDAIKNNKNLEDKISNGADLEEDDIIILKKFAKSIKSLQESRKDIEEYIDLKMNKIAPNLQSLLGSTLGAKLISHAGSLKRLAMFPASTIQIMGAEKALFRHLKTGENPPKYGLIYQDPIVRNSNYWNRGKIARKLALKISLAVKRDYFTDKYEPGIKEEFEKEVEIIEKENPFPKTRNQKNKNNKTKKTHKKSKKQRRHKKRRRKH